MATVSTEHSICHSCRHVRGCTLHRHGQAPVLECEEFEMPRASDNSGPHPAQSPLQGQSVSGAEAVLLGLCQNCRARVLCRLPRPEGGIWFCEEYEVE